MNELIKITKNNNIDVVRARDLYIGLGLDKSNYSKWERKILSSIEYIENEDFALLVLNDEQKKELGLPNNVSCDLLLTLNTAKHEAMKSGSSKAREFRQYFIDVENKVREVFSVPQTYAEALQLAADQARKIEIQNSEILELKPKAELAQTLMESEQSITIGQFAKSTGLIGQNKLFELLRQQKYLMTLGDRRNTPYQTYIDQGLFEVIEKPFKRGDMNGIGFQTLITPKGQERLFRLIKEDGDELK